MQLECSSHNLSSKIGRKIEFSKVSSKVSVHTAMQSVEKRSVIAVVLSELTAASVPEDHPCTHVQNYLKLSRLHV